MNISRDCLSTHFHKNHGFSIAELLVTITVLGVFLYGLFQTFIVLESQRVSVVKQAAANDVAYSNLSKFPVRPNIPINGCLSSINLAVPSYNFVLENSTTNKSLASLESSVQQSVVGVPVDGCNADGTFKTRALKIISTVTHKGGSASHATYVQ